MLCCRSGTATCTWKRFMAAPSGFGGGSAARLARRLRLACSGAAGWRAIDAVAGAAVLGEETEQRVHPRVVRRVIDEASLLPGGHEPGMKELLQVERQR